MHIVIFAQKMLMECYLSIKDKLPNTLKMEDLIGNWDNLHISPELLDLLGCIILGGSKEKHLYIGLSARKYLMRPYEHSEKFHKMKITALKTTGMNANY